MKKYIKPITEMPDIDLRDCIQDPGGANTEGNLKQGAKGNDKWETEENDDSGFGW